MPFNALESEAFAQGGGASGAALCQELLKQARQPMGFEWLARKQALPMQLSQDGLEECVFVFVLQREI